MKLFDDSDVVLVTGGSRGIGRAVAIAFGREGANVVLTYRNDEAQAKETVDAVQAAGGRGEAVHMDLASEESVRGAFRGLRRSYGRLDVVVNNAGVTSIGLLAAMSKARFSEVVDIDLAGPFLCCREAMRIMANQRRGSIVNVSSALALRGGRGQSNYCAAKAGVISMTQALALEAAPYNIRVNAVSPGYVATDMIRGLPREHFAEQIPLGRVAEPEEIANAIVFVASSSASYMTGSNVVIDGGIVVK